MAFERKACHHFAFKVPKVDSLVAMEKKLTSISRTNFEATYGSILDLLHVKVDITALVTLAHFFDLPLHGIPSGIKEFMGYCRAMMTAYKNIVKRARKRL
ncbi:hypothetical protein P8452_37808 [Trifolium repens]|nr:hypothetical protein QL285_069600 [Trifolium repens]WJX51631.1 hypothetical protein P8452_37808 [Trifolium repens]